MQLEVGMWENWKDLGMVATWLSHQVLTNLTHVLTSVNMTGLAGKVPVALYLGT